MAGYVLEGPKWATTTLTWSFADLSQPNSGRFSGAIGGAYQAVITAALAQWQSVSGIAFVQVPDSTPDVDVRFGWTDFGSTSQIGETDYSYSTGAAQTFLPGVLVRLEDPAQQPVDASLTAIYQGSDTTLYQTALHEVGHVLGLAEATDPAAVEYESLGPANRTLDQSDLDGIHALYGTAATSLTDTVTGVTSHPVATSYLGSALGVLQQLLYSGSDAVAISTATPDMFIQGGAGDDAIAVSSGRNIIDGSLGSNFLVGGTGTDDFYVDGRGTRPAWDTIVNFHSGDTLTLWGFDPAVSALTWSANDGAAAYTGATLHTTIGAAGVAASITFAGLSGTDQARLAISTGSQSGVPFAHVTYAG